jgi:tRNA U34 2-thiouridine synthase MnmA/TrmU
LERIDRNNDQSYFLALLSREQVQNMPFPMSKQTKIEIRKFGETANLPNCKRKDNYDIFVKMRIQDFLLHCIQNQPGDIVDIRSKIISKHRGLFQFTISQRHGINIPSNLNSLNYAFIGKYFVKYQLVVENEQPTSKFLLWDEFSIHSLSFIMKGSDNMKICLLAHDTMILPR